MVVSGILVWQYMTREQARSLKAQPDTPLATPLPPTLPREPGFVPIPIAPDRPADAGHPQAPLIPDLPGLPQADPLPHVLSTPIPEQAAPTIFHQDRNEGLEDGAKTYSSRARRNARAKDSKVTGALQDDEWRAHHLFAVAVAKRFPRLVAAAVRAGWRMDGQSNVVALPASLDAQTNLQRKTRLKRPVHDNRHPVWNERVEAATRGILDGLADLNLVEGSPEYDQAARRALEAVERAFRRSLRRIRRVLQNDQATPEAQI